MNVEKLNTCTKRSCAEENILLGLRRILLNNQKEGYMMGLFDETRKKQKQPPASHNVPVESQKSDDTTYLKTANGPSLDPKGSSLYQERLRKNSIGSISITDHPNQLNDAFVITENRGSSSLKPASEPPKTLAPIPGFGL